MSVPVDLAALKEQVAEHGDVAFLVTSAGDGGPHVVSVRLAWDGDRLVLPAGKSTLANVPAHPAVTLLWPSGGDPSYCLIADAVVVATDDDARTITVEPTHAILHRLADADASIPYCRQLTEPAGG